MSECGGRDVMRLGEIKMGTEIFLTGLVFFVLCIIKAIFCEDIHKTYAWLKAALVIEFYGGLVAMIAGVLINIWN
jgi:hypothetical protein